MLAMLQVMWLLVMAFFTETAGAGTNEEEEESNDEEEEEEEEDDDDDVKDPKARIHALEEEKSRHAKKAKRAERERDDALRKIKEYEDAQKSDVEKQSDELQGAQSNLKDARDYCVRAE